MKMKERYFLISCIRVLYNGFGFTHFTLTDNNYPSIAFIENYVKGGNRDVTVIVNNIIELSEKDFNSLTNKQ